MGLSVLYSYLFTRSRRWHCQSSLIFWVVFAGHLIFRRIVFRFFAFLLIFSYVNFIACFLTASLYRRIRYSSRKKKQKTKLHPIKTRRNLKNRFFSQRFVF